MTDAPQSYRLLDSGNGRKLEQVGPYVLDRQAPQALWSPTQPRSRWRSADGLHHRSTEGGGHWEWSRQMPESWVIEIEELKVQARPTPFGHIGVFAEQAAQWAWMRRRISERVKDGSEVRILNLFAYTGLASLACAQAGAAVCHVDAAHGVVSWARENAELNGLSSAPIRWIVDDCRTFVEREVKRGRTYDGLMMDPPTFGRGAKRQVWKIEQHLHPLLRSCSKLLSEKPLFWILSSHTPGYTPLSLTNILRPYVNENPAILEPEEMVTEDESGSLLPAGAVVRASLL